MSVKSALLILGVVLGCVLAAQREFYVDPTRIYTPDDLEELQVAAAYEKCVKTPGCDTSIYAFPQPRAKCQEGAGADAMMNEMMGVRVGGGAGVTCNSLAGEVLFPATGQCVKLLSQGPCPPSQWVQLSRSDLTPICAPKPCGSRNNAVMMNGVCQPINLPSSSAPTSCPPTQQLITNEFGEGECDCSPGTVFYPGTRMCYTPYTQGPCTSGYIIKVVDAGMKGEARCVPNSCPKPNMVRLDNNCQARDSGQQTTCHDLNSQGPCESGVLRIDNTISEPLCITTHSIFGTIGPRCPRGSIRDARGRCRTNLGPLLRNTPSFVTSRPRPQSNNRHCPPGQVFMAGICLRLVSS